MKFSQASVKGKPTYELAEEAKNNLELCLECCASELKAFEDNGSQLAPAPYFFDRATLLLKKQKRWKELKDIAKEYLDAIREYKRIAPPYAAKIWLTPKVQKIQQRLEQAVSILES